MSNLFRSLEGLVTLAAHETGHAVTGWASPFMAAVGPIEFFPERKLAQCGHERRDKGYPESVQECLELVSVSLGGSAGEGRKLNGFDHFGHDDLLAAVALTSWARELGSIGPRWPRRDSYIQRKLRGSVPTEFRAFLERAYDLALSRLETHAERHERLYAAVRDGYIAGKLTFDKAFIAERLGPKPQEDAS